MLVETMIPEPSRSPTLTPAWSPSPASSPPSPRRSWRGGRIQAPPEEGRRGTPKQANWLLPHATAADLVEVDECYVGGKPRPLSKGQKEPILAKGEELPVSKRGRGTRKIPVVAVVQREGKVRRRAIANITSANIEAYLKGTVHGDAAIMTDELNVYPSATKDFKGGHYATKHKEDEYARTDEETGMRVHSNTAESLHALLKRGIVGVYHRISPKHLHRYLAAADWAWNTRGMSDGDRVLDLIRGADGRRLFYRTPRDPRRVTAQRSR
jgi:hypothetical protein